MGSGDVLYSIAVIALLSALTFGARLFPFIIFGRGGRIPPLITYLGEVLPPAVMALLIVYCLRNIDLTHTPNGLRELAAVACTFILYKLTKNNLIAMVGGTVTFMVLLRLL